MVATYDDDRGSSRTAMWMSSLRTAAESQGTAGTVTVTGGAPPQQAVAVEATLEDPDSPNTITWQWQRADAQAGPYMGISDATGASYTPSADDVGKWLRAVAVYNDDNGSNQTAVWTAAAVVEEAPATPGTVTVTNGDPPRLGVELVATLDDPNNPTNIEWQWKRSNTEGGTYSNISGATSASLTPEGAGSYSGKWLQVVASYEDDTGTGQTAVWTASLRVAAESEGTAGTVAPTAAHTQWTSHPPRGGALIEVELTDPDTPVSISWQWQRSDTQSGRYTSIPSATSTSYTPTVDDAGKWLRAVAVYNDNSGSNQTAVWTAPFAAKVGIVTVTNGDPPSVGVEMEATLSDPDNPTTVEWQWQFLLRSLEGGWQDISGATNSSYTPVAGDHRNWIRVVATYDDDRGSSRTAIWGGTGNDPYSQVNSPGVVTVTKSDPPQVGVEMEATLADADGSTHGIEYQWQISRARRASGYEDISSATSASYEPVATDVGKFLRVVISYHDSQHSNLTAVWMASSAAVVVTDTAGTVSLTVDFFKTRAPRAGGLLGVFLDDPNNPVSISWQWKRADAQAGPYTDISGETDDVYTPTVDDAGKWLRAVATYTDDFGSGKMAMWTAVAAAKAGTVTVTGGNPPRVDAPVAATLSDPDNPTTVEWQWKRANTQGGTYTDISSATNASYTPVADDVGKFLQVVATYDDNDGSSRTAIWSATAAAVSDTAGTITVTNSEPPRFRVEMEATLDDPDNPVSVTWQWSRANTQGGAYTDISGETSDSYDPERDDVGKWLQVVATYTDNNGSGQTATWTADAAVPDDTTGFVEMANGDPPRVGREMTAELVEPDTPRSIVWSWRRSDSQTGTYERITGANSASYTPVADDAGMFLRLIVSYHDAFDVNLRVMWTADTAVASDTLGTLTVTGGDPPRVGTPIAATLVEPDNPTSIEWQWSFSFTQGGNFGNIASANSASYTPLPGVASRWLRVVVTYHDDFGSSTTVVWEASSAVVGDALGEVTVTGGDPPRVGREVAARLVDPDNPVSVTWKWQNARPTIEGPYTDISGATSSTYTPVADDAGKYLQAVASYTDDFGSGKTAVWTATAVGGAG